MGRLSKGTNRILPLSTAEAAAVGVKPDTTDSTIVSANSIIIFKLSLIKKSPVNQNLKSFPSKNPHTK
jgi:hypothetical protein